MPRTWSVSRDQTLQICERKYYFQYASGARLNSRDPTLREIAVLKKMTNEHMWKGKLIHDTVAAALNSCLDDKTKDIDCELAGIPNRVKTLWNASVKHGKSELEHMIPVFQNGGVILIEHMTSDSDNHASPETISRDVIEVASRFQKWADDRNLIDSIRNSAHIWIEPSVFSGDAPGFTVDGTKVFAKVDLALSTDNREFSIFDWKTGKKPDPSTKFTSSSDLQAYVYLMWPRLAYETEYQNMNARFVYIGDSHVVEDAYTLDERKEANVLDTIRRSAMRMKVLDSAVASTGQKKLDSRDYLTLEDLDFSMSTAFCSKCSFKRLCRRDIGE